MEELDTPATGSEDIETLDTGSFGDTPEEGNTETATETASDAAPVDEQTEATPEEGQAQNQEGEQPENIIAKLNEAYAGKFNASGKPFEGFRDEEHFQRVIQQGVHAPQVVSQAQQQIEQYKQVSEPYQWLNEAMEKTPGMDDLFRYMRADDRVIPWLIGAVKQAEQAGYLDRRAIDLYFKDQQLSQYQTKEQQWQQQQQQAQEQQQMQELAAYITQDRGGIPPSPTDMALIEAAVLRAQKNGLQGYTAQHAYAELKELGYIKPPKADPNARKAAAGPAAKPQAQRPRSTTPVDDDVWLANVTDAFGGI